VTATWLRPEEMPLLRRLAYALPHHTIARTTIAVTARGIFLRCSAGIEAIPLGTFFTEVHPALHVPAGYDVTPAVSPEILRRAIGAPEGQVLFVTADAKALAIDAAAFGPLEAALVEATPFEPVVAEAIESLLTDAPLDLTLAPLGAFPMGGTDPPPAAEEG
jgi:hypothetical protein